MDRKNKLRDEPESNRNSLGSSNISTDQSFMTAADSSSKYFSLSEVDSTFDITPIDDVTLASTAEGVTETTLTESGPLISNLSPIAKKNDISDSYKIGKQIEAANILSGGVNIFDNDNSYDGDELVIDDNVSEELKPNSDTLLEHQELPCDKNEANDELADETDNLPGKDTEVVLQIDGNNVNAIDIGNGLYLYRKDGEEELAAVQILDDNQSQPSFKFLKVRENVDGNLEVYEEIEIEMPKQVPEREQISEKIISKQIPIKNFNKAICEPTNEGKNTASIIETSDSKSDLDNNYDGTSESKTELNFNVKMKLSEARKSPVIGSFTPMTQSTPNKEGVPLTKIMVDQQLHPNRSYCDVKKKIEVHTDILKQRHTDVPAKVNKDLTDDVKSSQTTFQVSKNDPNLKLINYDVNSDKNEVDNVNSEDKKNNKDGNLKEKIELNKKLTEEINIETKKTVTENINQLENNATLQDGNVYDTKNENKIKIDIISSTSEFVLNEEKKPIDSIKDFCKKSIQNENNIENQASTGTETILNEVSQELSVNIGEKSEEKKIEECPKKVVVDQDIKQIKIQTPKSDKNKTEDKIEDVEHAKINTPYNECKVSSVENDQVTEDSKSSSKTEENITENAALNLKAADECNIKIIEMKGDIKISSKEENLISYKTESLNNNNAAVPFGKWTEANRQEFLNKFKAKVPTNNANTNQIKQPNDLNRRDVLKNIDRHRQTNNATIKSNELSVLQKQHVKNESLTYVSNVVTLAHEIKSPLTAECTNKSVTNINADSPDFTPKPQVSTSSSIASKTEIVQRKEINNQDLIDKAIEHNLKLPKDISKNVNYDDIERKMNELHGTPLVERPDHELREIQARTNVTKTYDKRESLDKETKIPKLLPLKNKPSSLEVDSEEEIITHVPITGDINHANISVNKVPNLKPSFKHQDSNSKKDGIITEKEFDKFARRNSVNYENCLKIKLDRKEPHNIVQTIVEKDDQTQNSLNVVKSPLKKSPLFSAHQSNQPANSKVVTVENRPQSKVQIAYQSVLTAKHQKESPITVIEDKPVKVIFVDTAMEFIPTQLNVQGKELTPTKPTAVVTEFTASCAADSEDFDLLNDIYEGRAEEGRTKTKHQRKQVLTPVDTPELELIEPIDLVIEESPKKKRKTDENKDVKKVVHKKTYLLGRNSNVEDESLPLSPEKTFTLDNNNLNLTHTSAHQNETVSAIDNLVKAAELIETQSEINKAVTSEQTPLKRGRGRPRKYPVLEGAHQITNSPSSPPKKPRLIDAKPKKQEVYSSEDESDEGVVKENWTMGKINDQLVCPICNKLFRSENVIFKHVKHCTGPSPNRSDQEKRISRRHRASDDSEVVLSEIKSNDHDMNSASSFKTSYKTPTKRKSRLSKSSDSKIDATLIKHVQAKPVKLNLLSNTAIPPTTRKTFTIDCIMCEICGKTFRQMSYLNSHKLIHEKEPKKQLLTQATQKSVASCEVCKKDFRQPHHLAQHRLIHKPVNDPPSKISIVSSSDQKQTKQSTNLESFNKTEVPNAGFRCERCFKSFRKSHHLAEHKETHDGLDKQKASNLANSVEKSVLPPQCDVCKKTFRKRHHLIEHKQQHLETGSEKSDGKSSSLSTKDIIHECSLCYMVFPNEHSLNKHTIICERKRRQAAAKLAKQAEAEQNKGDNIKTGNTIDTELIASTVTGKIEVVHNEPNQLVLEKNSSKSDEEPPPKEVKHKSEDEETVIVKKTSNEISLKLSSAQEKGKKDFTEKKVAPVVGYREEIKETSEDDVRYMLNPFYKTSKSPQFKSKEFVKRRTSLQHPKVLKSIHDNEATIQKVLPKSPKAEITPATDSDDSDVKYSFPKENSNIMKDIKNTARRKSLSRRSLTGLAKNKFTPKSAVPKPKSSSAAVTKRRTAFVEHRCDCGELFSSSALLARHTSQAHTPPRIRRRRESLPHKMFGKKTPKQETVRDTKTTKQRNTKTTKQETGRDTKTPKQETGRDTRQSIKKPEASVKRSAVRTTAHGGVPVSDKMKKAIYLASLKK